MKLKVLAPAKVVLESDVRKVVARSPDGYFCLLEHHIDFASALAPGVLAFTEADGRARVLAVDEGTLVRCGDEVLVATRNALTGEDAAPETITATNAEALLGVDEGELTCRRVIASFETEVMQTMLGLGEER